MRSSMLGCMLLQARHCNVVVKRSDLLFVILHAGTIWKTALLSFFAPEWQKIAQKLSLLHSAKPPISRSLRGDSGKTSTVAIEWIFCKTLGQNFTCSNFNWFLLSFHVKVVTFLQLINLPTIFLLTEREYGPYQKYRSHGMEERDDGKENARHGVI